MLFKLLHFRSTESFLFSKERRFLFWLCIEDCIKLSDICKPFGIRRFNIVVIAVILLLSCVQVYLSEEISIKL